LSDNSFFNVFFSKVLLTFHLVHLEFFLFGYIFTLFYFLFVSESAFVFDDFNEYRFEYLNNWDKLGSFFGLNGIQWMTIQLLGQLNGIKLITLEKACKKVGKTKEIDVFFSI